MSLEVYNLYNNYYSRYSGNEKCANSNLTSEFTESINTVKKESVTEEYKRKHPESASHVDDQIRAGKSVLKKNGVEDVSREEMSMDEYKAFIMELLNSIPFDYTRLADREIVSISDAGWEQMKNDADYEAWILGYTVENRSVRNPFAGWTGATGNLCIEKFGASIEEHLGQSFPMNKAGSNSSILDDGKSWWQKRHEEMEEELEKYIKKAQKRKAAQEELMKQESLQKHFKSSQRLTEYLNGDVSNIIQTTDTQIPKYSLELAALAYDMNVLKM